MTQNLISLHLSNADLDALDHAIEQLEARLSFLLELSVDERRSLLKMGDKSEAFCRQAGIILGQNPQILPSSFDLPKFLNDITTLDQLRPRLSRLRQIGIRADDTETALGSDIYEAALEGYAFARVSGKGAGLDALKDAAASRFARRRKTKPAEAADPGTSPATDA